MDPLARSRLGRSGLQVTRLGFGGATLGDLREVIDEQQASATIEAAHAAGVAYFDTAPWYGAGKSELRFGHVLRTKPRAAFVLSTKVGRVFSRPRDPAGFVPPQWAGGARFPPRFDSTRGGLTRSYEETLLRLGLDRVDA